MTTRETYTILALGTIALALLGVWFLFVDVQHPEHTCHLSTTDPNAPCDCSDFLEFQKELGVCRPPHVNYYLRADADEDGCVDDKDRQILFPGNKWDACASTTE